MEYTVDKKDLLSKLRDNRAEHAAAYLTAIEKYRERSIEFFNAAIDKIKDGGDPDRFLNLPMPEEHTDDFDRVIEGLEWHQGDTVTLDERQLEMLVRNRWGWHQTFTSNTTSYLAS